MLWSVHLRCQILGLWCFLSSLIDVQLLFIFEGARGSTKLTTVPSQISPPKASQSLTFVPAPFVPVWVLPPAFALGPFIVCLWAFGPLPLWPFSPLALWPFGPLAPLALWPFGPLALWPLALWVCGPLALWGGGWSLALWPFGPFGLLAFNPLGFQPFWPLALWSYLLNCHSSSRKSNG